jgi:hypothetical protein
MAEIPSGSGKYTYEPVEGWGKLPERAFGDSSLFHEPTISAQAISATEPSPLFYCDGDEETNQDCTWVSTAPASTNAPSPAPRLYTRAGMSSGSPFG